MDNVIIRDIIVMVEAWREHDEEEEEEVEDEWDNWVPVHSHPWMWKKEMRECVSKGSFLKGRGHDKRSYR